MTWLSDGWRAQIEDGPPPCLPMSRQGGSELNKTGKRNQRKQSVRGRGWETSQRRSPPFKTEGHPQVDMLRDVKVAG